eukprot:TRINITY_DN11607_c1_g1_i1.p1 TRINITY_DN11607_c1_g1~~TRINITY_DN11607_c1_g1_i1.p1  ORF type:complete len:254 (+),score=63.90 TRINITY_DN11607_c1_g1_i1:62-823(+)
MLTQMLAELDGIDSHDDQPGKTIFVIAATNRPDIMDRALLRPGRLDELILIPLPDAGSRLSIFKSLLRNSPISPKVQWDDLVQKSEGFSGADIAEVCNKVCKMAIRESIEKEERRSKGEIVVRDEEEDEEEEWEEDTAAEPTNPDDIVANGAISEGSPPTPDITEQNEIKDETENTSEEEQQLSVKKVLANGNQEIDLVPFLTKKHFDDALKQARRSVSKEYAARFEAMAKQIKISGSFDFKAAFDPLKMSKR